MNNFAQDLAATNTENESEDLKKEALKLEELFKDFKGSTASQNTQTTLAKVTQKVTTTQGAIAGMDSLKQSIFEAKESREKTLKFIAKYDEKIRSQNCSFFLSNTLFF
jgi:oligoribonuclease (3'-5' exoribonuclease)